MYVNGKNACNEQYINNQMPQANVMKYEENRGKIYILANIKKVPAFRS